MRAAVLTSGGDAPGMNAAIRAVVRTGVFRGMEVVGVRDGFAGLLRGDFTPLGPRDVGNILQHAGTVLGSARCPEFATPAAQNTALDHLRSGGIDALVVIGGSGSQRGAAAMSAHGFPTIGIASTIDNDLHGTDVAIGVSTALDVVLEAADRLRATASSHRRAFLIEVMGRDCGYLALMAGIACGAEAIIVPEVPVDPEALAQRIRDAYRRGKLHTIVMVAEGAGDGAEGLTRYFDTHHHDLGFDLRVTKLGHVQRGGAPGVADRLLATRLGDAATTHLSEGRTGVLLGWNGAAVTATRYAELPVGHKSIDLRLLDLAERLTV